MNTSLKLKKYIFVLLVCIVISGLVLFALQYQSETKVSITTDRMQTRFIGEEIIISGTSTGQEKIYLDITGPDLPVKGSKLEIPYQEVIDNNSSTFSVTGINPDNTWIFTWNTSRTGLRPGTYTIYAAASPRDLEHRTETRTDHIIIVLNDGSIQGRLKVLVTGFEEFGGYSKNPSKELVNYINSVGSKAFSNRLEIRGIVLPVLYYESWNRLHDEILTFNPDVVLCYGYSPGSQSVSLERTARNYDGGIPDNNKVRHLGPVIEGGSSYYISSLPLAEIEKNIEERGINVRVSDNAGSYICNHIFYQVMYHYRNDNSRIAGFIHLPGWETDMAHQNLSQMFNMTIVSLENRYFPQETSAL